MGVRISFKTSFVSLIAKGIHIHCRMETVWKRVMCEVKAPQDGAATRVEVLPQRGVDITLVFSLSISFLHMIHQPLDNQSIPGQKLSSFLPQQDKLRHE